MQTKDLIASILLLIATCGGVLLSCLSYYARSLLFIALVAGAVFVDSVAVEFFSIFWYRGTTRGFEVTLLDVIAFSVLVGSVLAPRHPYGRIFWPAGIGLMVLFIFYAMLSLLAAEPWITGAFELHKMMRGLLVFAAAAAFLRTERELGMLVFALGLALWIEAIFGLKQRYVSGMDRVPGTIMHPNTLSMYLCMVVPVVAAAALANFPKWLRWWCGAAVGAGAVAIVLTVSRAGLPIFAAVMLGVALWCFRWRITARGVAVLCGVLLAGTAMIYQSWDTISSRFSQATLEEEYFDPNKEGRGVYLRWAAMIVDENPYGVGLNNWSYYVSRDYGARLGFYYEDYGNFEVEPSARGRHAAPAHNAFALTAGELGIPGLIIFSLMWLRWFQLGAAFLWRKLSAPMHRVGVGLFFGTCGIFLQSMTEWTYRQTVIFFTFNILLGALASLTWARRHTAPAFVPRRMEPEEIVETEPAAGRA
jgi:hypothetical protein